MVDFNINMVFSNFDKLEKSQMYLEKQMKLVEKTSEKYKELNTSLDDVNEKLKETNKRKDAFSTLISGTVLDKFSALQNKFTKFNEAFETIGKKKGFDVGLSDFFTNFGKQSVNFSKNIGSVLGKGLGGASKTISLGLKGIMVGFHGIAASIGVVLGPLALIAAAAFVLWRAWKQNLGGMQTYFFKITGALKDAWAKVSVAFDKSLRSLAPVFKLVFGGIYMIIMPVIKIIEGAFLGLIEIINPIMEAIGEIYKPFAEMFGLSADGEEFKSVLEGISKVLIFIGKVVGTIIRTVLKPMIPVIKAILTPIKWLIEGIKFIVESIGKVSSFFSGDSNKKSEENNQETKKLIDRQKSIQTISNLTNSNQNSIQDNRNFTINSAGPINEQNAIGIINLLKKNFKVGNKI